MFTLYWIVAFAPARKSYRIEGFCSHGDFAAVSVTERSCAALISEVESHIIIGVGTIPDCFSWRHEKTSGMLWVSCSLVCGTGQGQN